MSSWSRDRDRRDHPDERPDEWSDDVLGLEDALVDLVLDATSVDSVPASHRGVVEVLLATRAPVAHAELTTESQAIAQFRSVHSCAPSAWTPPRRRRRPRHTSALFIAAALTVVGATGAAAAAGRLPRDVQDMTSELLTKVGISVPNSRDDDPERPAEPALIDPELPAPTIASHADARLEARADDTVDPRPGAPLPEPSTTRIMSSATHGLADGNHDVPAVIGDPVVTIPSEDTSAAPAPATIATPAAGTASPQPTTPPENPSTLTPPAETGTPANNTPTTPATPAAPVPDATPSPTPGGPPLSIPGGPPLSIPGGPPPWASGGPPMEVPGPPISVPGHQEARAGGRPDSPPPVGPLNVVSPSAPSVAVPASPRLATVIESQEAAGQH